METILSNILNTALGLAVGAVSGYAYAYFSGLQAMRKGMQLILRASLNDMYVKFKQNPPTVDDKQAFEEMYKCYENLGENGVMAAKREAVLTMQEAVRK
ncbi:hypothetical protein [Acidaminococcus massiliensis]|uniref:hypothetical protein n=1 Tax=Acidaminococcus massiliensis TaxID=1852375 RepID=UPI0022E2A19D|nr:hypothetical protein [Acidaminococcus massiliensis]